MIPRNKEAIPWRAQGWALSALWGELSLSVILPDSAVPRLLFQLTLVRKDLDRQTGGKGMLCPSRRLKDMFAHEAVWKTVIENLGDKPWRKNKETQDVKTPLAC